MSTFRLETVAWDDERAKALRDTMDVEMFARYADREVDPDKVTKALTVVATDIAQTLLAVTDDGTAVGHAALRKLGDDWEVKRVMVLESVRGQGVARALMAEIEATARNLGGDRIILQTGDGQPEAITLYRSLGYTDIPIYEPYLSAIPFSVCLAKDLSQDLTKDLTH